MRAQVFKLGGKLSLAMNHLEQSLQFVPRPVADALLMSPAIASGQATLIAMNAIEFERIGSFRYSPFYTGRSATGTPFEATDVYSAVAIDPVEEHGHCIELLKHRIRASLDPGDVCVLPHALARAGDAYLQRETQEWVAVEDQVVYLCRFDANETRWYEAFDRVAASASVASSMEVGFCGTTTIASDEVVDAANLVDLAAAAHCVFATALDGEGCLVWKVDSQK